MIFFLICGGLMTLARHVCETFCLKPLTRGFLSIEGSRVSCNTFRRSKEFFCPNSIFHDFALLDRSLLATFWSMYRFTKLFCPDVNAFMIVDNTRFGDLDYLSDTVASDRYVIFVYKMDEICEDSSLQWCFGIPNTRANLQKRARALIAKRWVHNASQNPLFTPGNGTLWFNKTVNSKPTRKIPS